MSNYTHRQSDRLCAEYYAPYGLGRLIYWLTRNRTCPICRVPA